MLAQPLWLSTLAIMQLMRIPTDDPSPEPVLLLRRGIIGFASLAALYEDDRFAIYSSNELNAQWLALARQLAAIVVATDDDPLNAFGFAVTATPNVPIIMLMHERFAPYASVVQQAGASALLYMPLSRTRNDKLLAELRRHGRMARVDAASRVLIDPVTRTVRYGERTARLTNLEYGILHHLTTAHGRPVAAEDLIGIIWSDRTCKKSRSVLEVHISHLRKKLAALGLSEALATLRGFGYAFMSHRSGSETTSHATAYGDVEATASRRSGG